MYKLLFILVLTVFSPAQAVQAQAVKLFGVDLQDASRDQLRVAVKKTGTRLIREAGADAFYDVYNSGALLHNSSRLYLGFVKKGGKFAFAEYEFKGLQQQQLLQTLIAKYGTARKLNGKYFTDSAWMWQKNAITITLYSDWKAYKTRLTYQNSENLKLLRQEQQAFQDRASQQRNKFLEQAY